MTQLNFLKTNIRMLTGILLLAAALVIPFLTPVQNYLSIPNELEIFHNSQVQIPTLGESIQVSNTSEKSVQSIDGSSFYAKSPGGSEIIYELAGMPIKKVDMSVLDDLRVIPGGHSIGVQLQTKGVLVVGHHLVTIKNGSVSPGEEADIMVGDVILEIDGEPIKEMKEVKPFVSKAAKNKTPLNIRLKRGDEILEKKLQPVMDKNDQEYKLGLYIRDTAAGIGTMTFYDTKSKKYGALGHVISDMDTKKPIQINDGTIVHSSVTSIEKGNNGVPGEKQATFSIKENKIGSITKNSPFGIFGKLNANSINNLKGKPLPVALSHEVKEGPATIRTVVKDEKVEEFDVEIVSSVPQKFPATKGMVIKITDEELLKKTGGIVQGMSGSPIIQNGKIIGAVTHVFVNDPTSGYGVHIEWMLQDAGIDVKKQSKNKAG